MHPLRCSEHFSSTTLFKKRRLIRPICCSTGLSTLPEVIRSPSLLIPLEALELKSSQLSHQKRKQPDQSYLLTVERALGAAAELLVAQLPPHEQQPNASSLIHALTHIVPRILSTATPLVCRRSSSTNATATKPKSGTKEKPNGSENHTNAVDRILGILVTSILVPLVRSFAPLSNNQFSTLILSPQLPKQKRTENATTSSSSSSSSSTSVPRGRSEVTVDIRYDVLGLINSIIEKLGEIGLAQGGLLVGNIRDLVQCLMLEAIRQLESLFQDESSQGLKNLGETQPTTSHHQQPQQDHQEQEHHQHTRHHHRSGRGRLAKVARKDSLWFLCSIIHLLLSSSTTLSGCSSLSDPPDLEEGTNDLLLGEAICTALSGMLRRVRDQDSCQTIDGDEDWEDAGRVGSEFWRRYGVIDEVERGMILAIIEKAALGG